MENTPNSKKGFASMTIEQKKAIASAGGKAAHAKGKAYKFDSVSAKVAGQKGGKAVSANREHMAEIGKKGGNQRAQNKGQNKYDAMISAHARTVQENANQ